MNSNKKWNWQQSDWPNFSYDKDSFKSLEQKFIHNSGVFVGSCNHMQEDEKTNFIIQVISDEALKTSEIEGEYLNRDSLQSSIRKNFGLQTDGRKIKPAEQGISKMLVDLYNNFSSKLDNPTMFNWHKMLMNGRTDLQAIGGYRNHAEPMQVISGPLHAPRIHFEAPPSKEVDSEMRKFIKWFNRSKDLPALARASIAHLYFISIHPFEDGNGRIGRAIVEKSLAESINQPSLTSLSQNINANKNAYYDAIERSNKNLNINDWIEYFSNTILDAQNFTIEAINFLISKTKFYDKFSEQINERQSKVIERIFREGLNGFKGGLSAENYITITKTSRATATRDLQSLVTIGAFTKSGTGKGTRYSLKL